MAKRFIDVSVALISIICLAPIMVLVVLLIAVTMGRPILFRQQRPGLLGRPFTVLKFRTMEEVFDEHGDPLPDSNRLTTTGRWLRLLSLDELPQLFNVLAGQMSLVGPRPLLMEYLQLYTPRQMRRHDVAPGITGWAQVHGRNALTWEQKFELDLWYVEHHSVFLDMRILGLTLLCLLQLRNVVSKGHATTERFHGTVPNEAE